MQNPSNENKNRPAPNDETVTDYLFAADLLETGINDLIARSKLLDTPSGQPTAIPEISRRLALDWFDTLSSVLEKASPLIERLADALNQPPGQFRKQAIEAAGGEFLENLEQLVFARQRIRLYSHPEPWNQVFTELSAAGFTILDQLSGLPEKLRAPFSGTDELPESIDIFLTIKPPPGFPDKITKALRKADKRKAGGMSGCIILFLVAILFSFGFNTLSFPMLLLILGGTILVYLCCQR